MPKALRPGVRYPIALESDMDIEPAKRPVFWVKSLSWSEQDDLAPLVDSWYDGAFVDEATTKEFMGKHMDFLVKNIHGWDNMRDRETGELIEFSEVDKEGSLKRIIDFTEGKELVNKFLANQHLTDVEKKRFDLLPLSNTENYADTATNNAKTKELQPNR